MKNIKLKKIMALSLALITFFTAGQSTGMLNVQAAEFKLPLSGMVPMKSKNPLLRLSTQNEAIYYENQKLQIENDTGKGLLISIGGTSDTANFAPAQVTWTNPDTSQKYQAYCINAAYSGYGDVGDYDVNIMEFGNDIRFSEGGSNGNGHLAGDTVRNGSISYRQALLGAVTRGYPTRTAEEVLGGTVASFGVSQDVLDYAAYGATKFAIWSIIHDSYDINKWSESASGSFPQALKTATLQAQKDIYNYAMNFTGVPFTKATLTAGEPIADPIKKVFNVTYTVGTENIVPNTDMFIRMDLNNSPFPADMSITDMSGNPLSQGNNASINQYVLPAGTTQFKVSVPIPEDETYSKTYSLMLFAQIPVKTLVFAKAKTDKVQDYILAGNAYSNPSAAFTIKGDGDSTESPPTPPDDGGTGTLKVIKLDAKDNATPLAGATFDLYNAQGQLVDTGTTNTSGIWIPNIKETGTYTVIERSTNPDYQLTEPTALVITVLDDRETTATFRNFKKQDVTVYKEDATTGEPIPGVQYEIYQIDGKGAWRAVAQTDNQGRTVFEGVPDGTYLVREVSTIGDYILDATPQYVTVRNGQAPSLKFLNSKHPSLNIIKLDRKTGAVITDPATFLVEQVDGSYKEHVTTVNGTATLKDLPVGTMKITEQSAPVGYVIDQGCETVYLGEGESKTAYLYNLKNPILTIEKIDKQSGKPIPNTKFEIKKTDGTVIGTVTTDADGTVTVGLDGGVLGYLDPDTYTVTEVFVPEPYVLSKEHQDIRLDAGDAKTLFFGNLEMPRIIIEKYDEETSEKLPNAQFAIYEQSDLSRPVIEGLTDENGQLNSGYVKEGTYVIKELNPPYGYMFSGKTKPERVIVAKAGDGDITVKFDNIKLPQLTIKKVDSVTKEPLEGVTYHIEQTDDKSVQPATATTDKNGLIVIPNLKDTTYTVTEISTLHEYILNPKPVNIKLEAGDRKTVLFENDRKPTLIVTKINALTQKGIPNTTFKIEHEQPDGGTKNLGTFKTDKNGQIHIKNANVGWHVITETIPAQGMQLPSNPVTRKYLSPGENAYLDNNTGTEDTDHGNTGNTAPPTVTSGKDYMNEKGEIITNYPLNSLVIKKNDAITSEMLEGAIFEVRKLNGEVSGTSGTIIGRYTTDSSGIIVITGLEAGGYICEEVKSPANYLISENSKQTTWLKADATSAVEITFSNLPYGHVLVTKVDSLTNKPLANARFKVTGGDGSAIGNSTGEYTTDENGQFLVENIKPQTVVITELEAPENYAIDTTPQTVNVGTDGKTYKVSFKNKPYGTLVIKKYNSSDNTPLAGAEFLVTNTKGHAIGNSNGIYVTDQQGTITIPNLDKQSLVVKETKAPDGFTLEQQTRTIDVEYGQTHVLNFYNTPKNTLIIKKYNSYDNSQLSGAEFLVTNVKGEYIGNSNGRYVTDQQGTITITDIPDQTLIIKETKSPTGFILEQSSKTVKVSGGKTFILDFYNSPKASLIVKKTDEKGNPLSGAVFKVERQNGEILGEGTTDADGLFILPELQPQWIVVREQKSPDGYLLNETPKTVEIKEATPTTVTFVNKKIAGLQIKKIDEDSKLPLSGVVFTIEKLNGERVGDEYVTDENGFISVVLEPNHYVVREIKEKSGYILDNTPRTVEVKAVEPTIITVKNKKLGGLQIGKVDQDNNPLAGVHFTVETLSGERVSNDELITDNDGLIFLPDLAGNFIIRETKGKDGYQIDGTPRNVTVKLNELKVEKFINTKLGGLQIRKVDQDNNPLSGVHFTVETLSGERVSNDELITDNDGLIFLPDLAGDFIIRETKGKDGYQIDGTPRNVTVKLNELKVEKFINTKLGGLQIKKINSVTHEPIEGVEFTVKKFNGELIGIFKTGKDGLLFIPDLNGIYTYQETKGVDGFIVDNEPRTVEIKLGELKTEIVENTPKSSLLIIKTDMQTKKPLSGVKFEVTKDNGEKVGIFETDKNGCIYINNLASGNYKVFETKPLTGYELDTKVYDVTVKDGQQTKLPVQNKKLAGLRIKKIDSITKQGIFNVEFCVFDKDGKVVGNFYTDNNGIIDLSAVLTEGRYTIRETRPAPNYYADDIPRTVEFIAGKYTEIEWLNTPKAGQIQILKLSADDNEQNGLEAGTPLEGAIFDVFEYKSGNLVDRFITGYDGRGVSKPLPLGRYIVKESQSPAYYRINNKEIDVTIEFATQIVKLECTNESVNTGVSIDKVAPKEVMPNQEIRYDIKTVKNDSSIPLNDFYIRDVLPVDAIRLEKIVTGTYSQSLKYKITAVTNKGNTMVVADNLKTTQNNVIDCSNASLGLANDEFVTSFTFYFGTVKAGFCNVERPQIYGRTLNRSFPSGYKFSNKVDIGGKVQGEWVIGNSTAVKTVYMPNPTRLPKTGY